jgi:hypothetical protein
MLFSVGDDSKNSVVMILLIFSTPCSKHFDSNAPGADSSNSAVAVGDACSCSCNISPDRDGGEQGDLGDCKNASFCLRSRTIKDNDNNTILLVVFAALF